jgi:hypothetical protein
MLDLPFSTELYLRVTIAFLVDSDVLLATRAARGGDVDFFLRVSSIFPSGA